MAEWPIATGCDSVHKKHRWFKSSWTPNIYSLDLVVAELRDASPVQKLGACPFIE